MLFLTTTSETLSLVTTGTVDWAVTWVDMTDAGALAGSDQGSASGAFTIVASPAASTQRQIKVISVVSTGGTITAQVKKGTVVLTSTVTLPNECKLSYLDTVGWQVFGSTGAVLTAGVLPTLLSPTPTLIPAGKTVTVETNSQMLFIEPITVEGVLQVDGLLMDVKPGIVTITSAGLVPPTNFSGNYRFLRNDATWTLPLPEQTTLYTTQFLTGFNYGSNTNYDWTSTAPAAGSDGQVQFNSGGTLGASPYFTFTSTGYQDVLRIGQSSFAPTAEPLLMMGGSYMWQGTGMYGDFNIVPIRNLNLVIGNSDSFDGSLIVQDTGANKIIEISRGNTWKLNTVAGTDGQVIGQASGVTAWTNVVNSFNTRTGAVTLTSGDVTGALGFTPSSVAGSTTQIQYNLAGVNAGSSALTFVDTPATPQADMTLGSGGYTSTLTFNAATVLTAYPSGSIRLQSSRAIDFIGGTGVMDTRAGGLFSSLSGSTVYTPTGETVPGASIDLAGSDVTTAYQSTGNVSISTGVLPTGIAGGYVSGATITAEALTNTSSVMTGGRIVLDGASTSVTPNRLTVGPDGLKYNGAQLVESFNTRVGAVTLTSGDVTTALGFTPGSGSVTSVAASVPAFLSVTGSPITTSGTLAITLSGTALPVANGGTGQTTATAAFDGLAPTQAGNAGKYLTTNGTTTSWGTVSAGTPAGSNTQVQFNSSGAFGGSSSLTYASNNLRVGNSGTDGSLQLGSYGTYVAAVGRVLRLFTAAATGGATVAGNIEGIAGNYVGTDTAYGSIFHAEGGTSFGGGNTYFNSGDYYSGGTTTYGARFFAQGASSSGAGSVRISTAGTDRLRIGPQGEFQLGSGWEAGSSGQTLTSSGSSAAPTWAYPAPVYTLATLPTPVAGLMITVSNANSGAGALCYSDGSTWKDAGTHATVV
jgi:hypothetical protein